MHRTPLLALLMLTLPALAQPTPELIKPKPATATTKPLPPKPQSRTTKTLEGWTVHVDDRLLAAETDADKALGERAVRVLSNRLYDITLILPKDKVERLRKIEIYLDKTHGGLRPAQYHPSGGWLKANGYDPKMAKAVHIPSAADFVSANHQFIQPWSTLHELAHAYHDQVLGFDHPKVKAAWKAFVDSGKYTSTLLVNGRTVKHYGLTNQMEFFAEMTEAYFGHNDFYPFNRGELEKAEPDVFNLLKEIWGPTP